MCLIVLAWKTHPAYRLVLAANRDEYHARPSRGAHWWPDRKFMLAGRDLQAGGTWLGVSRSGLFASVTNYRELQRTTGRFRSRGEIVGNFLSGNAAAEDFAASIDGSLYSGYSVLAADHEHIVYASNRGDAPSVLTPGVYGLSNASLDTAWPKLVRSRVVLSRLIASDSVDETSLLRLLADRQPAPVDQIDHSNLPFQLAQALSAPFVASPEYGTRCSTTLLWSYDNEVEFCERNFDPAGNSTGTSRFRFRVTAS